MAPSFSSQFSLSEISRSLSSAKLESGYSLGQALHFIPSECYQVANSQSQLSFIDFTSQFVAAFKNKMLASPIPELKNETILNFVISFTIQKAFQGGGLPLRNSDGSLKAQNINEMIKELFDFYRTDIIESINIDDMCNLLEIDNKISDTVSILNSTCPNTLASLTRDILIDNSQNKDTEEVNYVLFCTDMCNFLHALHVAMSKRPIPPHIVELIISTITTKEELWFYDADAIMDRANLYEQIFAKSSDSQVVTAGKLRSIMQKKKKQIQYDLYHSEFHEVVDPRLRVKIVNAAFLDEISAQYKVDNRKPIDKTLIVFSIMRLIQAYYTLPQPGWLKFNKQDVTSLQVADNDEKMLRHIELGARIDLALQGVYQQQSVEDKNSVNIDDYNVLLRRQMRSTLERVLSNAQKKFDNNLSQNTYNPRFFDNYLSQKSQNNSDTSGIEKNQAASQALFSLRRDLLKGIEKYKIISPAFEDDKFTTKNDPTWEQHNNTSASVSPEDTDIVKWYNLGEGIEVSRISSVTDPQNNLTIKALRYGEEFVLEGEEFKRVNELLNELETTQQDFSNRPTEAGSWFAFPGAEAENPEKDDSSQVVSKIRNIVMLLPNDHYKKSLNEQPSLFYNSTAKVEALIDHTNERLSDAINREVNDDQEDNLIMATGILSSLGALDDDYAIMATGTSRSLGTLGDDYAMATGMSSPLGALGDEYADKARHTRQVSLANNSTVVNKRENNIPHSQITPPLFQKLWDSTVLPSSVVSSLNVIMQHAYASGHSGRIVIAKQITAKLAFILQQGHGRVKINCPPFDQSDTNATGAFSLSVQYKPYEASTVISPVIEKTEDSTFMVGGIPRYIAGTINVNVAQTSVTCHIPYTTFTLNISEKNGQQDILDAFNSSLDEIVLSSFFTRENYNFRQIGVKETQTKIKRYFLPNKLPPSPHRYKLDIDSGKPSSEYIYLPKKLPVNLGEFNSFEAPILSSPSHTEEKPSTALLSLQSSLIRDEAVATLKQMRLDLQNAANKLPSKIRCTDSNDLKIFEEQIRPAFLLSNTMVPSDSLEVTEGLILRELNSPEMDKYMFSEGEFKDSEAPFLPIRYMPNAKTILPGIYVPITINRILNTILRTNFGSGKKLSFDGASKIEQYRMYYLLRLKYMIHFFDHMIRSITDPKKVNDVDLKYIKNVLYNLDKNPIWENAIKLTQSNASVDYNKRLQVVRKKFHDLPPITQSEKQLNISKVFSELAESLAVSTYPSFVSKDLEDIRKLEVVVLFVYGAIFSMLTQDPIGFTTNAALMIDGLNEQYFSKLMEKCIGVVESILPPSITEEGVKKLSEIIVRNLSKVDTSMGHFARSFSENIVANIKSMKCMPPTGGVARSAIDVLAQSLISAAHEPLVQRLYTRGEQLSEMHLKKIAEEMSRNIVTFIQNTDNESRQLLSQFIDPDTGKLIESIKWDSATRAKYDSIATESLCDSYGLQKGTVYPLPSVNSSIEHPIASLDDNQEKAQSLPSSVTHSLKKKRAPNDSNSHDNLKMEKSATNQLNNIHPLEVRHEAAAIFPLLPPEVKVLRVDGSIPFAEKQLVAREIAQQGGYVDPKYYQTTFFHQGADGKLAKVGQATFSKANHEPVRDWDKNSPLVKRLLKNRETAANYIVTKKVISTDFPLEFKPYSHAEKETPLESESYIHTVRNIQTKNEFEVVYKAETNNLKLVDYTYTPVDGNQHKADAQTYCDFMNGEKMIESDNYGLKQLSSDARIFRIHIEYKGQKLHVHYNREGEIMGIQGQDGGYLDPSTKLGKDLYGYQFLKLNGHNPQVDDMIHGKLAVNELYSPVPHRHVRSPVEYYINSNKMRPAYEPHVPRVMKIVNQIYQEEGYIGLTGKNVIEFTPLQLSTQASMDFDYSHNQLDFDSGKSILGAKKDIYLKAFEDAFGVFDNLHRFQEKLSDNKNIGELGLVLLDYIELNVEKFANKNRAITDDYHSKFKNSRDEARKLRFDDLSAAERAAIESKLHTDLKSAMSYLERMAEMGIRIDLRASILHEIAHVQNVAIEGIPYVSQDYEGVFRKAAALDMLAHQYGLNILYAQELGFSTDPGNFANVRPKSETSWSYYRHQSAHEYHSFAVESADTFHRLSNHHRQIMLDIAGKNLLQRSNSDIEAFFRASHATLTHKYNSRNSITMRAGTSANEKNLYRLHAYHKALYHHLVKMAQEQGLLDVNLPTYNAELDRVIKKYNSAAFTVSSESYRHSTVRETYFPIDSPEDYLNLGKHGLTREGIPQSLGKYNWFDSMYDGRGDGLGNVDPHLPNRDLRYIKITELRDRDGKMLSAISSAIYMPPNEALLQLQPKPKNFEIRLIDLVDTQLSHNLAEGVIRRNQDRFIGHEKSGFQRIIVADTNGLTRVTFGGENINTEKYFRMDNAEIKTISRALVTNSVEGIAHTRLRWRPQFKFKPRRVGKRDVDIVASNDHDYDLKQPLILCLHAKNRDGKEIKLTTAAWQKNEFNGKNQTEIEAAIHHATEDLFHAAEGHNIDPQDASVTIVPSEQPLYKTHTAHVEAYLEKISSKVEVFNDHQKIKLYYPIMTLLLDEFYPLPQEKPWSVYFEEIGEVSHITMLHVLLVDCLYRKGILVPSNGNSYKPFGSVVWRTETNFLNQQLVHAEYNLWKNFKMKFSDIEQNLPYYLKAACSQLMCNPVQAVIASTIIASDGKDNQLSEQQNFERDLHNYAVVMFAELQHAAHAANISDAIMLPIISEFSSIYNKALTLYRKKASSYIFSQDAITAIIIEIVDKNFLTDSNRELMLPVIVDFLSTHCSSGVLANFMYTHNIDNSIVSKCKERQKIAKAQKIVRYLKCTVDEAFGYLEDLGFSKVGIDNKRQKFVLTTENVSSQERELFDKLVTCTANHKVFHAIRHLINHLSAEDERNAPVQPDEQKRLDNVFPYVGMTGDKKLFLIQPKILVLTREERNAVKKDFQKIIQDPLVKKRLITMVAKTMTLVDGVLRPNLNQTSTSLRL